MTSYPTTITELTEELLVHSKDGRSDPGFRLNIALAQMGNLASHFTHDQKENPRARPYGTRDSEISDAGHAIVQLMTYAALRNINVQEAINVALQNLREKDFIKKEESDAPGIFGSIGYAGRVVGKAIVDPHMLLREAPSKDSILVSEHPTSDCRLTSYAGIITDHGGMTCHAAIIAREFGIPCIIGTGSATKKIRTGNTIILDAGGIKGQVIIIS